MPLEPPPPAQPRGRRAFRPWKAQGVRIPGVSLAGILATLLGLAGLAGLTIPSYFERPEVTLGNAALLLARDLRAAQNRAANLGVSVVVEIHPDGWRIVDRGGRPVRPAPGVAPVDRRLSADGVFEGVRLERIEFGGQPRAVFGSTGRPLAGGSVDLAFGGSTRRVHVDPETGRIRITGLEEDRAGPWE